MRRDLSAGLRCGVFPAAPRRRHGLARAGDRILGDLTWASPGAKGKSPAPVAGRARQLIADGISGGLRPTARKSRIAARSRPCSYQMAEE
jgi:hypothetical protein